MCLSRISRHRIVRTRRRASLECHKTSLVSDLFKLSLAGTSTLAKAMVQADWLFARSSTPRAPARSRHKTFGVRVLFTAIRANDVEMDILERLTSPLDAGNASKGIWNLTSII